MQKPSSLSLPVSSLIFSFIISTPQIALCDPPARVARLGDLVGSVSFLPAGENVWVEATLNRPLTTGDTLWNDADGKSELQLGNMTFCIGNNSSFTFLNLDNRTTQVQFNQGAVDLNVKQLKNDQIIEIDTPNLAFLVQQPGDYRIDVDESGNATMITVKSGQGEAYGETRTNNINTGQAFRFSGTDLNDPQSLAPNEKDDLDNWCMEHLGKFKQAKQEYVSQEVIGYEELEAHGTWQTTENYGPVWTPSEISTDWAPYQEGTWVWIDPWGWSWVGSEPWGFAPYHYGRWVFYEEHWAWIPGPIAAPVVYAPALVAFIGGGNFQLAIGGGSLVDIAWFPLGPGDIYWPAYQVSSNYFVNINVSDSLNQNFLLQAYQDPNLKMKYTNLDAPWAISGVPLNTFVKSMPVKNALIKVPKNKILNAPISQVAKIAPEQISQYGAALAKKNPPAAILNKSAIHKTQLPPKPATFEAKQKILKADPGKPVEVTKIKPNEKTLITAPKGRVTPKDLTQDPRIQPPKIQPRVRQPEITQPRFKPERSQPSVKPPTAQPKAPQRAITKPSVRQPDTTQPSTRQPIQPRGQQPEVSQPRTRQPEIQPRVQQPRVQQPSVQQPRVQQPRVQQPRVQQPSVQQPSVQQPKVQPPSVQQPNVQPEVKIQRPEIQPRQQRPQIEQRIQQIQPGRDMVKPSTPSPQPKASPTVPEQLKEKIRERQEKNE